MLQEFFDVIDEKGKVVGREPREKVHALGLRHRTADILVFNSRGQLFIQKRSASKDITPGCWDFSTCEHAKTGESAEQAAIRGLKEELRVDNILLSHVMDFDLRHDFGKGIDNERNVVFKCIFDGEIKFDPEEVSEGRFVELGELMSGGFELTPWFSKFLEKYPG